MTQRPKWQEDPEEFEGVGADDRNPRFDLQTALDDEADAASNSEEPEP